jgi:hypothetical protein
MKKYILILCLFAFVLPAHAQDDIYYGNTSEPQRTPKRRTANRLPSDNTGYKISVGVKPNFNRGAVILMSQGAPVNNVSTPTKSSLGISATINLDFNFPISLQLEPGYINKRGAVTLQGTDSLGAFDINIVSSIDYITLPLLLRYTYEPSNPDFPRFFVNIGTELNFMQKAKRHIVMKDRAPDLEYVFTRTSVTAKKETSLLLGAGLLVPILPDRIFISGEYRLGIGNSAINEDTIDNNFTLDNKNLYPFPSNLNVKIFHVYSQINAGVVVRIK